MDIVEFDAEHAGAAAEIAAGRFRRQRERCPVLPEAWAGPDSYLRPLEAIAREGSGIAAVEDASLVGYLAAWRGEGRGLRWAFAPEWAWGLARDDRPAARGMLEELYTVAAERWVADERRTHYVCAYPADGALLDALTWLGFGHAVMDGVRDLGPLRSGADGGAGATIRRAGPEDAATLTELEAGLRAHLAASPVFFALGPARTVEEHAERLAEAGVATFLATQDGRATAYLRIGPASDDAATVIRDPGTASISGAFTRPERRRTGVASTLLDAALAWAREGGYVRVAVDFETANVLASRFWTREFAPVTFSLARRV